MFDYEFMLLSEAGDDESDENDSKEEEDVIDDGIDIGDDGEVDTSDDDGDDSDESDDDDDNDDDDDSDTDSDTSDDDDEDNLKEIESNFFDSQKNELLFQNYYAALDDVTELSTSLKSIFDTNTLDATEKSKLFNVSNDLEDLTRKIEKIIKNFNKITYDKKDLIFTLCMKSITSSSNDINSIIGTERAKND